MIYLFSYSQNIKIEEIAEKLNIIEPSINFNYEKESNNTLPFLDILIIKSHNNLILKVYCKPTNKNDYIHFYSYHNNKIKKGFIIGFYLRALKICSPRYQHSLKSLKYPKVFILNTRKKAQINIRKITSLFPLPTDLFFYPQTHLT